MTLAALLLLLAVSVIILTIHAFQPVRTWVLIFATILAGVVAVIATVRVLT